MNRWVIWHTPEPFSAAARYPREMLPALTAQGVAVHLVCPRNYQFQEELGRNPLITLHLTRARSVDPGRGPLLKLWTNLPFLLSSVCTLMRTSRRGSIVHFQHVLQFPFSAIFFAGARLRGCTIVFTVHDPIPHRWFLPRRLRWIERGTLRWSYHVSDALIVHSEPGRRTLIEYFGLAADKITVIGRGPYGLGQGVLPMPDSPRLEVLLFGSIRENKGVHLAIEAVQTLHREGAAVRLTIAGEVLNGNEARYWARCREQIDKLPGPIRVRKQFITDELLPALFAESHCLLLPYTTFYSDSGVAFMALANGRPIVATRAGGLGPLFDAAEVGVAIEEGTPDGVSKAIRKTLGLGVPELERLGRAGAEYVNVECGWTKVASQTRELYGRYQYRATARDERAKRNRAHEKTRIILHTPEPKSAAARYVRELVDALTQDGVRMQLVCPENFQFREEFGRNPNVILKFTRGRTTKPKRGCIQRIGDNLGFLSSSLAALAGNSRRGDLVHFQFAFHLPAGLLFFLTAKLRGCKIVFTVHDPFPHKWLLPECHRWLEKVSLAWAYRLSDRLIVHSEAGKRTLVEAFGQEGDKISVIAHGPYDLGCGILPMAQSDCLELLMFGSLRENKGLHLAIEAVQRLDREGCAVRLTIAGDVLNAIEDPYWVHCLEMIAENPLPIRVFQEFIPDNELASLFRNCHAVLLPYTRFFSDSGVALMALANGRSIIATRSGGLGPLIDSANLSVAINEISATGVAEAIREAMALGIDELERRGKCGADYVHTAWGWDKIASQTKAIYARCLTEEPARSSLLYRTRSTAKDKP